MFWAARALHWLYQQVFCPFLTLWRWDILWLYFGMVVVYLSVRGIMRRPLMWERWELFKTEPCWGSTIAIIRLERGIPSKRTSSACIEYVSALCTHRPSLLPIEWFSEYSGGGICVVYTIPVPERLQTVSFRGSTSRNKVSVGEPADGSLRFWRCLYISVYTHLLHKYM